MRVLAMLALCAASVLSQVDPQDVEAREKLARQARRNMTEIERVLDSIKTRKDPKTGGQEAKKRGEQVVKDLDELIKFFEIEQSSSGTPDNSRPRPNSKPKNQKRQKSRPEPRRSQEKENGDSARPSDPKRGKPRSSIQSKMEKAWGNLPPKLRQALIDRNFKDFTPEYEQAIKDYFKSISRPRKR